MHSDALAYGVAKNEVLSLILMASHVCSGADCVVFDTVTAAGLVQDLLDFKLNLVIFH